MSFDVETLGAILACSGGYSGNLSASKIVNTVSGSPAVIEDASNLPLEGIDFYGETKLVPTPGKNLLKNTADSWVQNGINFTVNSNGSIAANGKNASPVDVAYIEINKAVVLKKGSYLASTGNSNASRSTFGINIWNVNDSSEVYYVYDSDVQIDVTEETATYWVRYFVALGATTSNETVYPMIREASITDSTYEPYLGDVTSPSPDHPLLIERTVINQVEVTRKNLLDTRELKTVLSSGITFTPVYEDDKLQYINVNGTATGLSLVTIGNFKNTDRELILSGCPSNGSNSTYKLSYYNESTQVNDFGSGVTLPKNDLDYEVRLVVYGGTTMNNVKFYPMIRHAEIADPTYEPFQCHIIDLPEPIELNGMNGVRDSNKWKCFETVVFDGTENWTLYSEQYPNLFMLTDIRPYGNGLNSVLCTHFPYDSGDLLQGRNECRLRVGNPTATFYISSIKHSNVAEFKTWLAEQYANGTPVTLTYELSEPEYVEHSQQNINAIKSAHTYKPNTVITNNANALMDVHYVADRKSYIDKKFAALANAVLNQ